MRVWRKKEVENVLECRFETISRIFARANITGIRDQQLSNMPNCRYVVILFQTPGYRHIDIRTSGYRELWQLRVVRKGNAGNIRKRLKQTIDIELRSIV